MELFADLPRTADLRPAPSPWTDVETPLGRVNSIVYVEGEAITTQLPALIRTPSSMVTLYAWQSAIVRAELLRIVFPESECVAGSVGLVWRFATWHPVTSLEFECRWIEGPRGASSTPVPAAALEALQWVGDDSVVTIGTQDARAMASRARENNGFPRRVARSVGNTPVEFRDDGLCISTPPLDRHEQCQVHFVVAWGAATASDATRYAVDWDPTALVLAAQAG